MLSRSLKIAGVLLALGYFLARPSHVEHLAPTAPTDRSLSAASLRPASPIVPSDSSAATLGPLTADDVRRIGRKAYVWGWPLVFVHNCRISINRVPALGRCGGMPVAPVNELCMLTDYISPKATAVPCPNHDVVYGCGFFDLGESPVVLQVPDFGDRFWVYQLGDQRTDGFADLGKMYDTKPGPYLVVGPGWNGATPAGIVGVLRCPTRLAYCLPRVFLDDTAEDRQALLPIVSQIMAYPLGRFGGAMKTCDWAKVRWFPYVGTLARSRGKQVEPETFFAELAEVLVEVPPQAGEEPLYDEIRRLLTAAKNDAGLGRVLAETAAATENEVIAPLFEFRNVGTPLAHHWTTIANGAAFGTDYLTRTAVARSNIFVNRHNESKYFYQDLDAAGRRLDGRQGYRVTFAAGKLPPAKGFWSLTLYNEHHGFHPNELNRYSLGTKSRELKYDSDGSLTIYVGGREPEAERQANWLPAPAGPFSLYLRAYWPEAALLSGQWTPPAVVADDSNPARVADSRLDR